MLVLNIFIFFGVVIHAVRTQDWAKSFDDTLSGEMIENNLKD